MQYKDIADQTKHKKTFKENSSQNDRSNDLHSTALS